MKEREEVCVGKPRGGGLAGESMRALILTLLQVIFGIIITVVGAIGGMYGRALPSTFWS